jgi:hypothetical protein
MDIVFSISLVVGIGYQAMILYLFGVPPSISEGFYLLDEKRRGLGWLFYGWAAITVFTVCPMMFALSDGRAFQFLALFTGAGLLLAGAEPHFKEEHRHTVHLAGAGVCAGAAVLWMAGMGYGAIPAILAGGTVIAASLRNLRSLRNGEKLMYWVENAVMLSMYVTLGILLNRV